MLHCQNCILFHNHLESIRFHSFLGWKILVAIAALNQLRFTSTWQDVNDLKNQQDRSRNVTSGPFFSSQFYLVFSSSFHCKCGAELSVSCTCRINEESVLENEKTMLHCLWKTSNCSYRRTFDEILSSCFYFKKLNLHAELHKRHLITRIKEWITLLTVTWLNYAYTHQIFFHHKYL